VDRAGLESARDEEEVPMHSHAASRESASRRATLGRRLAGRAAAITWQSRHRPPERWADPNIDLLNPNRAPEESYRDYVFRTAIWP
jgi:hypothetical protein